MLRSLQLPGRLQTRAYSLSSYNIWRWLPVFVSYILSNQVWFSRSIEISSHISLQLPPLRLQEFTEVMPIRAFLLFEERLGSRFDHPTENAIVGCSRTRRWPNFPVNKVPFKCAILFSPFPHFTLQQTIYGPFGAYCIVSGKSAGFWFLRASYCCLCPSVEGNLVQEFWQFH